MLDQDEVIRFMAAETITKRYEAGEIPYAKAQELILFSQQREDEYTHRNALGKE